MIAFLLGLLMGAWDFCLGVGFTVSLVLICLILRGIYRIAIRKENA